MNLEYDDNNIIMHDASWPAMCHNVMSPARSQLYCYAKGAGGSLELRRTLLLTGVGPWANMQCGVVFTVAQLDGEQQVRGLALAFTEPYRGNPRRTLVYCTREVARLDA